MGKNAKYQLHLEQPRVKANLTANFRATQHREFWAEGGYPFFIAFFFHMHVCMDIVEKTEENVAAAAKAAILLATTELRTHTRQAS